MQEKNLTGYPSIDKPWLKYYAERPVVSLPNDMTLYRQFAQKAIAAPDALAYIDFMTGAKMTYGELLTEIDQFAAALAARQLGCGDTVGVLGFLSSVDPAALFAANKVGATLKYIDPDAGPQGMARSMEGIALLVMENLFHPMEPMLNQTGIPTVIYGESDAPMRGNCVSYPDFLASGSGVSVTEAAYEADRAALIIYSSGSTGDAKPIVHSNRTVTAAVEKMLNADFPIGPENLLLKAIPSHIGLGAITTMLTALLSGAGYIQLKGMPEPSTGLGNETVALLQDYKSWLAAHGIEPDKGLLIFAAPFFADFIMNAIDTIADLSFVKGVLLGGAKMEREPLEQMDLAFRKKGLTVPIGNGYGQNEMGGAVALNTVHYNKNGSAGYPVYQTDVKIVDRDTFEELPFNTQGLILEQSDSAFLHYDKLPEKSDAARITLPDGSVWYDSTDLGHMDEDGYIFITGRTTRVVMRTDHKVSLEAIEEKLRRLSCVSDAAVTAPEKGTDIFAFVSMTEDMDAAALQRIIETEAELSVFEAPTKVIIKEALPRMNNGKIDYQSLEKGTKDYHEEQVSAIVKQ